MKQLSQRSFFTKCKNKEQDGQAFISRPLPGGLKKKKVSTVLNMYSQTFLSAENAPTLIAGRPGQGMEILLPCGDVKADY